MIVTKLCSACDTITEIKLTRKGHGSICRGCKAAKQRAYRVENGNIYTKRYEKTKKGFLMRLYRNMQSRISGVQKEKFHLYKGKDLLGREEFMLWAGESNTFHTLFAEYKLSGYTRKLCPSVDRIDSELGYSTVNMEWVTMSENSRRGANSRHHNTNNKAGVTS